MGNYSYEKAHGENKKAVEGDGEWEENKFVKGNRSACPPAPMPPVTSHS